MSKLSDAAYELLQKHSGKDGISSDELWIEMKERYPDLCAIRPDRKTPRTTLMRDLRKDKKERFVVANRRVKLKEF